MWMWARRDFALEVVARKGFSAVVGAPLVGLEVVAAVAVAVAAAVAAAAVAAVLVFIKRKPLVHIAVQKENS